MREQGQGPALLLSGRLGLTVDVPAGFDELRVVVKKGAVLRLEAFDHRTKLRLAGVDGGRMSR